MESGLNEEEFEFANVLTGSALRTKTTKEDIISVDTPAGARVTPYKPHERTCKSCGKLFIPNRIDQKYCSKKCRAYYHSAAQASRKREAKDKAAKA